MLIDMYNKSDIAMIKAATVEKKVGITSGTFDLYHYLHLIYLQRCRRECDVLIVGVDCDQLVRDTKGSMRPIIPEHQRVAMVASQVGVAAAFVLPSADDFGMAVKIFGADIIFKNDAFKPEEVYGKELAEVKIISDVRQPDSTSGIIEEIIRRRTNDGQT